MSLLNLKISVAIICSNNEDTIRLVLESIKDIAFEIVVIVDENSRDRTYSIVSEYTSKVSIEPWRGFVAQKNEVIKKCSGDWILSLDSDEVLTNELKEEIISTLQNTDVQGYFLNRRTVYSGVILKYAWQPDDRLRLVSRAAEPIWVGGSVHETLELKKAGLQIKTKKLKNYIDHYSYKNITDHFQRTIRYAYAAANDRYAKGKRFNMLKMIFAPMIAFIKQYFIKFGLLDGWRGFVASFSAGFYSFMKQIFLLEFYWNENKK